MRWLLRNIPEPLLYHPWEMLIAGLCLLSGIPLALGAPSPSSMNRFLSPFVVQWWGGTLGLGGSAIVVGLVLAYVRPRVATVAWRIERAGLALLGSASLVYGVAIATVAGWPGVLPAATYSMFAAACMIRAVVLQATARGIKRDE